MNNKGFRDGCLSDLPDFATFFLGSDVWAPDWLAGFGVGVQLAYIVDRYGRPYLSFAVSGGGGILPISLGYSEGYVNRWDRLTAPPEDRHIASPGELDELIPGPSFVLDAAAIMYFSGEVSLDHTWNDYWMGALGYGLQLSIGMGGSWTTDKLPSRFSVNPKGWIGVEDIPRYEEKDIPRQWDSDSIGCGC